jgi:hypothetical protein
LYLPLHLLMHIQGTCVFQSNPISYDCPKLLSPCSTVVRGSLSLSGENLLSPMLAHRDLQCWSPGGLLKFVFETSCSLHSLCSL